LAGIHRVDWKRKTPYPGKLIPFEEDVIRGDRFFERAAYPERLIRAPELGEKLLPRLPANAPIGVFHGEFQAANFFCSPDGRLLAIIDWELVEVGATLNDVGWVVTFSDPDAWAKEIGVDGKRAMFLQPNTLIRFYAEAWGESLPDLNWYRALAAYKFAAITGFNLNLHRRGKRPDPLWETTGLSMRTLIDRALELLG